MKFLYSSAPAFFLTCFSFLRMSHVPRISSVTQCCTLRQGLSSTSSAAFVITVLKLLVNVSDLLKRWLMFQLVNVSDHELKALVQILHLSLLGTSQLW